jgi:hypothetical protein
LQGRRGGREIRPIAFPALGFAKSPRFFAGLLGSFPSVDGRQTLLFGLEICDRKRFRKGVGVPPLREDRRKGKETCHHQSAEIFVYQAVARSG